MGGAYMQDRELKVSEIFGGGFVIELDDGIHSVDSIHLLDTDELRWLVDALTRLAGSVGEAP